MARDVLLKRASGAGGNPSFRPRHRRPRFRSEFWIICLAAVLIPASMMQSLRPVDLVTVGSLFLFSRMVIKRRLSRPIVWILAIYFLVLGVRVILELQMFGDPRTLLGMTATYATCVVFFVTREAKISRQTIHWLLGTGVAVSVFSQLSVLPAPESYVSGVIWRVPPPPLEEFDRFSDTTITVWRALSVGITFAAIVGRTSPGLKLFGLIALLLQFGAGGGGRSALLFVVVVPVALLFLSGGYERSRQIVRAGALGLIFAALYYGAPLATSLATKEDSTHQERILQVFSLSQAEDKGAGRFSGRVATAAFFLQQITSGPETIIFGTGLSQGAAFESEVIGEAKYGNAILGQAHNIFLDTWALSGLIGLLFLIVFLGYVVSDLRKLLDAAPKRGPDQILAFALAAAIMFMFQWLLFQATASDRPFMTVFYLLAGLLAPATRMIQDRRNQQTNSQFVTQK
jgi:O-antigen ligase